MEIKKTDRRKFLFAGFSLAAIWATFRFNKKPDQPKTVRFLTQDGRLVEIDATRIPASKRAASKTEIQHWIKK